MITAPSDMRKATGILPRAGGRSGFGVAGNPLPSAPVGTLIDAALAGSWLAAEKGIAAAIPSVAELLSRSLLFIMLSCLRRHLPSVVVWEEASLSAMPTSGQILPSARLAAR